MQLGYAAAMVFTSGFAIMVLEVVGARYLAADFGSTHDVWVSQIGVILAALALGYSIGGWLVDRRPRARVLTPLLLFAGGWVLVIPWLTPPLLSALVDRHPLDRPIPALWQKLDPVLGSALVFFLPCFVWAMLPPWMIRLCSTHPGRLGATSGSLYAAGTLGSIAGVFVSGYIWIEHMTIPGIFRTVALATLLLGAMAWDLDRRLARTGRAGSRPTPPPAPEP